MKPNPICITKQKLLFENEGERELEREIQRRKGLVKSRRQTCVVYFSSALCCSLCLCLSFLFSLCLCCVCICSLFLYLPLFFFLFLRPFFFWIMANQLSFGSLFFSFQSFLIGNGRLGGFLASRGLPLYIYILNIFWSHPIIQSTTVSLLFVLPCRCMYL